jgi:hypothetical protein
LISVPEYLCVAFLNLQVLNTRMLFLFSRSFDCLYVCTLACIVPFFILSMCCYVILSFWWCFSTFFSVPSGLSWILVDATFFPWFSF